MNKPIQHVSVVSRYGSDSPKRTVLRRNAFSNFRWCPLTRELTVNSKAGKYSDVTVHQSRGEIRLNDALKDKKMSY